MQIGSCEAALLRFCFAGAGLDLVRAFPPLLRKDGVPSGVGEVPENSDLEERPAKADPLPRLPHLSTRGMEPPACGTQDDTGWIKFALSHPCFARMGHPSTGAQDDTGWVGFVLFPLAAQGCAPGQGWGTRRFETGRCGEALARHHNSWDAGFGGREGRELGVGLGLIPVGDGVEIVRRGRWRGRARWSP